MTPTMTKSFVSTVFLWMFAALGITAATAFLFGTNEGLMNTLISITPEGSTKISIYGSQNRSNQAGNFAKQNAKNQCA